MDSMETITFNLKPLVRHVTYHGKEYMVVPLTMLMPGVLNGSKGPLFYPEEEISRNSDAWNAIPIVVNHPTDPKTGEPVSARSPEVLADNEVGRVYYTKAGRGLGAEGWFDVSDTKRISTPVYNALKLGQKIELSTGLFTENELAPDGAVHNGKPYKHIARNYRPDHLAILPYQKGACGISDGCGVGVLTNTTGDRAMDREATVNWLTTNCDCWKADGSKETLNTLKDTQLETLKAGSEEAAEALRIAGEAKKGITIGHQEFKYDTTTNSFTVNNSSPTPSPKPTPATPTPSAPKPAPAPTPTPTPAPGPSPTPGAVTNEDKVTTPIVNETDWLAAAPESVRNTFLYAKSVEQRDKDALVARITANMDADARASMVEKLRVKSLVELNDWLLVSNSATPVPTQRPFYMPDTGYAPAAPVLNDENDILELPKMTYEPLVSKRKA